MTRCGSKVNKAKKKTKSTTVYVKSMQISLKRTVAVKFEYIDDASVLYRIVSNRITRYARFKQSRRHIATRRKSTKHILYRKFDHFKSAKPDAYTYTHHRHHHETERNQRTTIEIINWIIWPRCLLLIESIDNIHDSLCTWKWNASRTNRTTFEISKTEKEKNSTFNILWNTKIQRIHKCVIYVHRLAVCSDLVFFSVVVGEMDSCLKN